MAWWERLALVLVLSLAAATRLVGLDWDAYQHHHPDERYITWVATTIERPDSLSTAFDPYQSTINPFRWPPGAGSEGIVVLQDEPRAFAYGHVPLYLGVLATRLAEALAGPLLRVLPPDWTLSHDILNGAGRVEFHHIAAVGRALAALLDLGTVALTFLLTRRLYGTRAGLFAAALLALTVLHIQSAHFFISDPFLTFFITLALWLLVLAQADDGRRAQFLLLLGAAATGLAIGSKFTAVLMFLPLAFVAWRTGHGSRMARLGRVALAGAVVVAVFAFTNPFAVIDWTCGDAAAGAWSLQNNCYMENIARQNQMVSGDSDQGFVRQYDGTVPYLYFIEMQLRWGMGPLLGLLAFAGLGWAAWRAARPVSDEPAWRRDALLTLLLWVVPYFLLTGMFHAKFMRYMLPISPMLMVFGGGMVQSMESRRLRLVVGGATLVAAALYALAFVGIYAQPHPWNEASAWIYRNAPPGSLILSEQWDDYLPVSMEVDGQARKRGEYENAELTWLSGADEADNDAKLLADLALLAEADYVTVLSNRVYGVAPRLPQRYPLSGQYHQLLFDGSLGYELVWVGGRYPRLAGLALKPDSFGWPGLRPPAAASEYLSGLPGLSLGRADESFTVYDQPLTMIFRNVDMLSVQQLRAQFEEP